MDHFRETIIALLKLFAKAMVDRGPYIPPCVQVSDEIVVEEGQGLPYFLFFAPPPVVVSQETIHVPLNESDRQGCAPVFFLTIGLKERDT